MTEEIFKTSETSIPSTKDGAISTPKIQMVIVCPDGVACLRQLLEKLDSKSQNIIILQDDIEQEARGEISRSTKYQNIVIDLLKRYKEQLGISHISATEISDEFKENWKTIFESQGHSFSNSISYFCKNILQSPKEESDLKKFIDTTFWPEWTNAVTLDCINEKKDSIIILAPKVAGNKNTLQTLATTDTSFSYLYTGKDSDTPSINYLMKEYKNEKGATGPFVLTSGKFSNHVKKFIEIVQSKKIEGLENTTDIKVILDYLNKNEELKKEVMGEFQTYLIGIVAERKEAINTAIKETGIVAKPLPITVLPKLSPKHKNVLTEGVRNTVLSETQTQTLGR